MTRSVKAVAFAAAILTVAACSSIKGLITGQPVHWLSTLIVGVAIGSVIVFRGLK